MNPVIPNCKGFWKRFYWVKIKGIFPETWKKTHRMKCSLKGWASGIRLTQNDACPGERKRGQVSMAGDSPSSVRHSLPASHHPLSSSDGSCPQ